MTIVNKFNVNKEQVTFGADIIENMSANDVSYDDSTQYDENTVGNKLSELEKKVGIIKESKEYLYNTILFDSSDVSEGDVLYFKTSLSTSSAKIRLYNSTDTEIGDFGTVTDSAPTKEGKVTIPSGFSYAKVVWSNIRVDYLYTDVANSLLRKDFNSLMSTVTANTTLLNLIKRGFLYLGEVITADYTPDADNSRGCFYLTLKKLTYTNFKDKNGSPITSRRGLGLLSKPYTVSYWSYVQLTEITSELGNNESIAMSQNGVRRAINTIYDNLSKKTKLVSFAEGASYPWELVDSVGLIVGKPYKIKVSVRTGAASYRVTLRSGASNVETIFDDVTGSSEVIFTPTKVNDSIWISARKDSVTYTDPYTITIEFLSDYAAKQLSNGENIETSINYLNPVSEFVNKFNQLKRKPRWYETEQNITPWVVAHFSDIHGDTENVKRIIAFCNKYNSYLSDIICGGDIHKSYWADGISWYTAIQGTNKILTTIGNHDYYATEDGISKKSASEVYDRFIAPFYSNWGDGVSVVPNKCYYYKDYSESKIRLIVIDYFDWNAEQESWLNSVLSSANTSGYHVVISSHYPVGCPSTWNKNKDGETIPITGSIVDLIECPFTSYQERKEPTTLDAAIPECVQNFINNGGNFVCYITGHTHLSFIGTLRNYPNQLNITIDCSSSRYSDVIVSDIERVIGTKSQDLFNILSVDTYNKVIKLMRIGADYDSWMRKIDTISYSYKLHKILK